LIHRSVQDGDAFFPEFDQAAYRELSRVDREQATGGENPALPEGGPLKYSFIQYEKIL
jgi:hypothetical protein